MKEKITHCKYCDLDFTQASKSENGERYPCIEGRTHILKTCNFKSNPGDEYRIVFSDCMEISLRYECPDCGWSHEFNCHEGTYMAVCEEGHRHEVRVTRKEASGWRFDSIIEVTSW